MSNTSWSAIQYKNAALKHFDACENMLKNLNLKKSQKSAVLSEVYYLGGYVIECALKYFILINQGDKTREYSAQELNDLGLWHHELRNLVISARDVGEEINFTERHWCEFTRRWDVQLRYGSRISSNDYSPIVDFFWKDVLEIYEIIKNN